MSVPFPLFPEEEETRYDARCTTISTGVRAIWLLYTRRQWKLLESLGIDKDTHSALFALFTIRVLNEDTNRLSRESVGMLIRFCPAVLDAAIALTGAYMIKVENTERKIA